MANYFDDDSRQVVRPTLWPLRNVTIAPGWQDEVFTQQGFYLQDSSTFLWAITVTDAGILQATKGATGSAIAAVYLNNIQSDTATWQLGITTAGLITAASATFDGTQANQFTLISAGNVTWYLHITTGGILQTSTSENWNQLQGAGLIDKQIAIHAATDIEAAPGAATTYNTAAAYWNSDAFPSDQFSQIQLSAVGLAGGGQAASIGAAVRMGTDGSMYVAFLQNTSTASTVYLYKFTNTASTLLGSQLMPAINIGDTIQCRAQGTTISAFYNGNQIIQVTDSTVTSGQAGVFAQYTTTGDQPLRGDNWSAGLAGPLENGEFISYQTATLTSTYKYNIGTRIRRGVAGSPISNHSSGSQFLRLDDNVAEWDYDPQLIGQTVFLKFTSFNLRGMQEESIANAAAYPFEITGSSLGLLTPAHATYRPTSNPLTGHDAGASATINITGFSMRIPGITDIIVNSGSISGLSYNTLYYVYYDDPGFVGGTVVYLTTTTKEIALTGAGRFFVGSILTPISGGIDTIGNNDGGSGSQYGMIAQMGLTFQVFTTATGGGAGATATVTNPTYALDTDSTTAAVLDCTVPSAGVTTCSADLIISGAPGMTTAFEAVQLQAFFSIPTNTVTGGVAFKILIGFLGMSSPGVPVDATQIYSVNAGVTMGLTEFTYNIPINKNLAGITVQLVSQIGAPETGEITANIYTARIISTQ